MIGELFENYKHYKEWMLKNWERNLNLDKLIIETGLVIERLNSCSGEVYRSLNEKEFLEMQEKNVVEIPNTSN